MRDIKFQILWTRHKSDFTKEVCTHYTTIARLCDGSDIFPYNDVEIIAKRQFTGIFDKNGKEIYEGDIVKAKYYVYLDDGDKDGEWVGYVQYSECQCIVNTGTGYNPYISNICLTEDWEVIGNIHEHPELLK